MSVVRAVPERRNDIDWIRVVAVLLLIPFHSARIFNVGEDFYVKNDELSQALSYFVVFLIGLWQMQLLFLLAGASTWYALRFRSGGQYVGERLKRLLVPFVFGVLVIVPPQMYIAQLFHLNTTATFLEYYPTFFQLRPDSIPNDYTGIGFSWAHLWFILFLLLISLIALPLFLWLKGGAGQRIVGGIARFLARGWAIFLLLVPLLVASELPDVDNKPFFLYLLLFVYGFVLMADARLGRALYRNRWPALILLVVTIVPMYAVLLTGTSFADNSLEDVGLWFARNLNLLCWLVAILGFGQRYVNADNRVLRYARDAAYPFYLLHQTVIVLNGYYVVQLSLPVLPKYLAIAIASLVITVALYDVVVRRTNATRFLFGMRPLRRPAAARVATA